MSTKGGSRIETPFDLTGNNKDEREEAEFNATAGIKRMVCQEGHEFLVSYYADEIIKEKR